MSTAVRPRTVVPALVLVAAVAVLVGSQAFAAAPLIFLLAWSSFGLGAGPLGDPVDVDVASDGTLYVLDAGIHNVQSFTAGGAYIRTLDVNTAGTVPLEFPKAIAVGSDGKVFVMDEGLGHVAVFAADGSFLRTLDCSCIAASTMTVSPSTGHVLIAAFLPQFIVMDSSGASIRTFTPTPVTTIAGIAVGPDGNLYVADFLTSQIVVYTEAGTELRRWSMSGGTPGSNGIAVGSAGEVYVLDATNLQIQIYSSTGVPFGAWSTGGGPGSNPGGLSVSLDGTTLFLTERGLHQIRALNVIGQTLRTWGSQDTAPGKVFHPMGIAIDTGGTISVADNGNNRIQQFDRNGTFLRAWGYLGTGTGQFKAPRGVATDLSGNVYVAESGNHRIQVSSSTGAFVRAWGSSGAGDGQLSGPRGVAVATDGSVYVADTGNNRVQQFTSTGMFVRAWDASSSGFGSFGAPNGIAVNAAGSVYVTDTGNNRVRQFTPDGTFVRQWGSVGTANGQFDVPDGITTDGSGTVYVVDRNNNRVQAFSNDGTFLASTGIAGHNPGELFGPIGAVFSGGTLYVADTDNNRLQAFVADTVKPTTTIGAPPVPASGWYTADVPLTFTAADAAPSSGVESVSVALGAGVPVVTSGASAALTVTAEGSTLLSAYARDLAGNQESPAQTVTIKLDKTAPTIGASVGGGPVGALYSGPVAITLAASDAASGVATIRYALDGGTVQTTSSDSTLVNVSADGPHQLVFSAVDVAGLASVDQTVSFAITSLSGPPDTATPTATGTATATATPSATPTATSTAAPQGTLGPGAALTATPTPTPSATPTASKTPTPSATPIPPAVTFVITRLDSDRLLVTAYARTGTTLQRLDWTPPPNARVQALDGTVLDSGLTLPPGATTTTFILIRTGGTSVTLPITATGSFGSCQTFGGGGPDAFR
jgi:sugar lactone lactonase YvrE